MFNFNIISFIVLSFCSLLQVTISQHVNTCTRERPSQTIINNYGSCCNSKKICMIPNGYKLTSENGAYKIHAELKSWNEARKTCVAEGAHLGVFTSLDEIRLIQRALPENGVPRVWVGYHDQFQEGDWTTVWDKPIGGDAGIVVSFWPNQPDDFQGMQDCAVLDDKGMDDDVCTLQFPFVCKFTSKNCDLP